MNIFVLDADPDRAARYHCDKHIVKMVLETAQLLSTVHHLYGGTAPYKPVSKTRRCTRWAAHCTGNYHWLWRLGVALSAEYKRRYGRTHKAQAVIELLRDPPADMLHAPRTGFVTDFKTSDQYSGNPVDVFRQYYRFEKQHFARWDRAPDGVPDWWKDDTTFDG